MKVLKVLAWIVGTPLVLFGLLLFARFVSCGPNSADVKVATPMVEKIADYIVEYGVPDSLSDIPDLPYRLEGCEKSVTYRKQVDVSYRDTKKKEDASFAIINEGCRFVYKQNIYKVHFRFEDDYEIENDDRGDINIRYEKTTVGTLLKSENGKLNYDGIATGFDNRFGFCAALKQ